MKNALRIATGILVGVLWLNGAAHAQTSSRGHRHSGSVQTISNRSFTETATDVKGSDKDNPTASACTEGAVIGGVAALAAGAIIDMLGGGGIATALTTKVILGAAITGCISDALHTTIKKNNEQRSAAPGTQNPTATWPGSAGLRASGSTSR